MSGANERFTCWVESAGMSSLWGSCVRSPSTFWERRLEPASNTFLNLDEAVLGQETEDSPQEGYSVSPIKRSRSFAGYLPMSQTGNLLWPTSPGPSPVSSAAESYNDNEDAVSDEADTVDACLCNHVDIFSRNTTCSSDLTQGHSQSSLTGTDSCSTLGQPEEEASLAHEVEAEQEVDLDLPPFDNMMEGRRSGQQQNRPKITPEKVRERGITTLMLHNLPFTLTQDELLHAVNTSGFEGWYDYAHAPYNMKEGIGHGYAFINFVTVEAAAIFVAEWAGVIKFHAGWGPAKPVCFSAAASQGYSAHVTKRALNKLQRIRNLRLWPFMAPATTPPSGLPGRPQMNLQEALGRSEPGTSQKAPSSGHA
mmetsp:Transcript_68895/g.165370  ORF Transcript_68895/g.165370 Transcript_68895/m.165370 type:complete len:366 (+) Transcript_68895:174-1271(+)|eukprot:CAMPEP_0178388632 /NCGR_PEP_ID=MMETSP0689_2-20121128/9696_1 /TAXON_ID=160604 /ORGANISM="Amphidinium massartii, Strain CS-259" /LENGTH=365 /DNA_ID=CAMNT_0020009047 /DNA_START=302 /DNA_END=1402 /DNA_ORIENTATION=+